jgi:Glycosyl transferase family 2
LYAQIGNVMTIHLYAQCRNDEWMLPYFFRHYDSLVDRYFLYDDGSSDATMTLLTSHPRVHVEPFPRLADSFVLSEQSLSNACWKQSRGTADWVIVTDVDEHLYHRSFRDYLARCHSTGVTLVPALGFQMISDSLPPPDATLCDDCRIGAPWIRMMKPSIFDPNAISEINFAPGRHTAEPTGRVRVPDIDEMMLFHYKYVGFQRTQRRHRELRTGLGTRDLEVGWGHKYSWSEERLREDWRDVAASAIDTGTVRDAPASAYPIARWWEQYREVNRVG